MRVALAVLLLLVGGGYAAWRFLSPADPAAALTASSRTAERALEKGPAVVLLEAEGPLERLAFGTLAVRFDRRQGAQRPDHAELNVYDEGDGRDGLVLPGDQVISTGRSSGSSSFQTVFGAHLGDAPSRRAQVVLELPDGQRFDRVLGPPCTSFPPAPSAAWQPLVALLDEALAVDWRVVNAAGDLRLRWRDLGERWTRRHPGIYVELREGWGGYPGDDMAPEMFESEEQVQPMSTEVSVEAADLPDVDGPFGDAAENGVRWIITVDRQDGQLKSLMMKIEPAR